MRVPRSGRMIRPDDDRSSAAAAPPRTCAAAHVTLSQAAAADEKNASAAAVSSASASPPCGSAAAPDERLEQGRDLLRKWTLSRYLATRPPRAILARSSPYSLSTSSSSSAVAAAATIILARHLGAGLLQLHDLTIADCIRGSAQERSGALRDHQMQRNAHPRARLMTKKTTVKRVVHQMHVYLPRCRRCRLA